MMLAQYRLERAKMRHSPTLPWRLFPGLLLTFVLRLLAAAATGTPPRATRQQLSPFPPGHSLPSPDLRPLTSGSFLDWYRPTRQLFWPVSARFRR